MVMKQVSPSKELSAFVPWMESEKIRELVVEVAGKHHFDLERPGYVLWVRVPEVINLDNDRSELREQPLGDLAICVSVEGYTLGLCKRQGAGFRVHYSRNWIPLRAFNDNGCPFRNLARANKEMYHLVSRYRDSDRSLIADLYQMNDAPA